MEDLRALLEELQNAPPKPLAEEEEADGVGGQPSGERAPPRPWRKTTGKKAGSMELPPEEMLKEFATGFSAHMEATAAAKRARTTSRGEVGELHLWTGAKADSDSDM